jgi:hypothetical protein
VIRFALAKKLQGTQKDHQDDRDDVHAPDHDRKLWRMIVRMIAVLVLVREAGEIH